MPGLNFRIYWDGDEYEEMFDGGFNRGRRGDAPSSTPTVYKWNDGEITKLGDRKSVV